MIKITNLHKFYNKNRNNEIHVINDCSLEFPNTGLVCLLGPSGSGKTTLLNVLGGLDKTNSGIISIKQDRISHYSASRWDAIRSKHFGYIFQNYNLLPTTSVYDNVAISLKMTSIDESLINERVMYALTAVNMERFKKKKVNQLSGGQQQRVSIARALVKSPDVIFADEPTGNLDEKNTTQIMNIIKKISDKCLVILVTHEERLASFYGDRIIRMRDGQIISDEENQASDVFVLKDDQNIYLKDMKQSAIKDDLVNLTYFFEKDKQPLDLKIVYRNNNFYIESSQKIKILGSNNEVKLIDAHKPVINERSIDDFVYQLDSFEATNKSLIKNSECIKMAFKRAVNSSKKRKFVLLAFMLISFLIVLSFSLIYGSLNPKEKYYVRDSKKLVNIEDGIQPTYTELKNALGSHGITYYLDESVVNAKIDYNVFRQTENWINLQLSLTPLSIDEISANNLIHGVMPTDKKDIVIDISLVNSVTNSMFDNSFKTVGMEDALDFIGKKYIAYEIGNKSFEGKIVGISNNGTPNTYMDLDYYYEIYLAKKGIGIKDTLNTNEVDLLNIEALTAFNNALGTTYTFHEVATGDFAIYISDEDLADYFLRSIASANTVKVISSDKNATISYFSTLNISSTNYSLKSKQMYIIGQLTLTSIFTTIAGIFLAIGLVFLFFMIRTNMISRVYEIGVYRSIGVKKFDIYKMFFWETVFIGFSSSLIGIVFGTYFVKGLEGFDLELFPVIFPWFMIIGTILFMFLVNTIIGLLPLFRLLRNTPSEITAKYDI